MKWIVYLLTPQIEVDRVTGIFRIERCIGLFVVEADSEEEAVDLAWNTPDSLWLRDAYCGDVVHAVAVEQPEVNDRPAHRGEEYTTTERPGLPLAGQVTKLSTSITKGVDEMTHTPGPWTVRYAENLTAIVTPKGEMQLKIQYSLLKPHLSCDIQEFHANAHLIAAAPDLLEALMGARGVLYSASCLLGTSFRDDAKYWHTIADEAIRKAEEQSQ